MVDSPEAIFAFIKERHSVYLKRQAGEPFPWTEDPILQRYRFTNVYRELDTTTIWFRDNVRTPHDGRHVMLATVIFRWFNRIKTAEAIFKQPSLMSPMLSNATPWELLIHGDHPAVALEYMYDRIKTYCGHGPYVTGVYVIKTPDGMNKLHGVLRCVEWFINERRMFGGRMVSSAYLANHLLVDSGKSTTLGEVHQWLMSYPYLGSFMAAQIIADLKYTALLSEAPDWHTWAASGPGSKRGLNYVLGRDPQSPWNEFEWHAQLLKLREALLPMFAEAAMPEPHAQDIQNCLCEYAKYCRGSSRNIFRRK